jgi:hypothetical protein
MMPGFTQIDSQRFYREAWPKIKQRARDAHQQRETAKPAEDYPIVAQSNWDEVKAYGKYGAEVPPLMIYWGYKNDTGTSKIILAISRAAPNTPDQHWISPDLIEP